MSPPTAPPAVADPERRLQAAHGERMRGGNAGSAGAPGGTAR